MPLKIKHIVFLTPGFAESENDSTTIPALQVYLKAIRKSLPDTKLTIITFQFPFSNETYNWNGFEVIPFNGKNKKWKKPFTWFKVYRKLKEIHKKNEINALHSFWIGECSLIGNYFSRNHNIPHVITAMGQDVKPNNSYMNRLNSNKNTIVTLSENQQNLLKKNYKKESILIPWNLDILEFPKLSKTKIDILGVGSLNDVKNFDLFIEIVNLLTEKYPNIKSEIVGNGNQFEKLQKKITKLKLNKNIILTGNLSRENVLQKMSEAKIFLHTSSFEGFGFVFAEALYSGMKIVSFDVGFAKSSPEWFVCNSFEEILNGCITFLEENQIEKRRLLLHEENQTVSGYLKLYNA